MPLLLQFTSFLGFAGAAVTGQLVGNEIIRRQSALSVCPDEVNLTCLRKLYNIEYTAPDNISYSRLGVVAFHDQDSNHRDVADFLWNELGMVGFDFTVESINGGNDPQERKNASDRAQGALGYTMALGHPVGVTYYATGGASVRLGHDGQPLEKNDYYNEIGDDGKPLTNGRYWNAPWLELVQAMLDKSDDELPHVLTIFESDDEESIPKAYAEKVCDLFGQLTKRGVSIIAGASEPELLEAGGACLNEEGERRVSKALFPASCPWVTGVGKVGHRFEPPQADSHSFGGFSHYFERHSWQAAHADKYINWANSNTYYDLQEHEGTNRRGYPDISAVGDNLKIVNRGFWMQSYDNQATIFAAMIALVNDARLRKGKPALGFLNEILYSDKAATVLQPPEPLSEGHACYDHNNNRLPGWRVAPGWNPAAGLGVPNDFVKLLEVLENW